MLQRRRVFFGTAVAVLAATAWGAQDRDREQGRTSGQPPFHSDPSLEPPDLPKPSVRALKANQVAINKDMARLQEAVMQLRDALDANSTTEVLSLDVIHKTEEIEKLAKHVRSLVRA